MIRMTMTAAETPAPRNRLSGIAPPAVVEAVCTRITLEVDVEFVLAMEVDVVEVVDVIVLVVEDATTEVDLVVVLFSTGAIVPVGLAAEVVTMTVVEATDDTELVLRPTMEVVEDKVGKVADMVVDEEVVVVVDSAAPPPPPPPPPPAGP